MRSTRTPYTVWEHNEFVDHESDDIGSLVMSSTHVTATPWGRPDGVCVWGPGIVSVTTASHGGFRLAPAALAQVPMAWRLARFLGDSVNSPWFEEDRDWCFVALTFPWLFDQRSLEGARKIFEGWVRSGRGE